MIVPVPNHPGYWVSTEGRVFSAGPKQRAAKAPRQELHPFLTRGYPRVRLGVTRQGRYVHHLVLEAFQRPRRKGEECRHLDGNPLNCSIDNLAWGEQRENRIDQIRHGTLPLKVSDADVAAIRASTEDSRILAARYGISRGYVYNLRNLTWRKRGWA